MNVVPPFFESYSNSTPPLRMQTRRSLLEFRYAAPRCIHFNIPCASQLPATLCQFY